MLMPFIDKPEFDRILGLDCTPETRSALFADMCRMNIVAMIQQAGSGHYGSSFSSVDIMSAVFLNAIKDDPDSRFFSSKGHDAPALYAIMAGLGLMEMDRVHTLRRIGGLPGHPDVGTPNIVTNTGSLGMGISKAKGMTIANRLRGKTANIYAMLGDGELQEGQIWESLGQAATWRLGELTAIVDANKIQSDTWVEQTNNLGDVQSKFSAFGWRTVRVNGHDHKDLLEALKQTGSQGNRPLLILADTNKGHGVSFMRYAPKSEADFYAYHSGAISVQEQRKAQDEIVGRINVALTDAGQPELVLTEREIAVPPSAPKQPQKLVSAYADTLVELGKENPDLVVLDADLRLDCGLIPFSARYPDRFIECGIAEQDMVSMAGGMALRGMKPVVHSFACFLTPRANEQIYNNATERTSILHVGALAGVLPGSPGHSHQAVRDIAVMSAIPGMAIAVPCCEADVSLLCRHLMHREGSGYLRLFSLPWDIPYSLPDDYDAIPGRGAVLRQGSDMTVFAYGPAMLSEAWKAAATLATKGVSVRLVSLPWVNMIDQEWLKDIVSDTDIVVTIDDHYTTGGLKDLLASKLLSFEPEARPHVFKSLGVSDIPPCGRPDEVLKACRLDAEAMATKLHGWATTPR